MKKSLTRLGFLSLIFTAIPRFSPAEDEWPQFRGPKADGHSTASNVPVRWSESNNIAWKVEIPGGGHSSPVISGNHIWLTAAIEEKLTPEEEKRRLAKIPNSRGLQLASSISLRAICVDVTSGKILHNVELFHISDPPPKHSLNSYASPTPIIERGRLYSHFGSFGTACLDVNSQKLVWTTRQFKVDHQNGPGSSPASWKDLLIIHCDGIDDQYVAAIDKTNGQRVWKTKRSGEMHPRRDFQKAYCTPLVISREGRDQVISPAANWVYSYDPANGDELWKASYGKLGFSTVPRPLVGHGLVYICTSYLQSKLLAVRYDGSGDVTKSHIAWESDKGIPSKPSALLIGDELYLINDKGFALCLDAKSGNEHWRTRLGGQYSASPVFADGRIYVPSQDGRTIVIKPGIKYQHIATNELDGRFMASPAVIDNAIFFRTDKHMYRVGRQ